MDVTSTVRSDVLPAVGSLLVPGAVASAPYLALLWGPPHDLKGFVDANQGASTAAATLLVIAVGLLIESVGSFVEYYLVDGVHADRDEMVRRWREYLGISWQSEPIGQHYLRRILTVFKFELNLLVASVATMPGTIALAWYGVLPKHGLIWVLAITVVLAGYLYYASVTSSVLLDGLRQQLISQARSSGALK